jgi:hypothetical protein
MQAAGPRISITTQPYRAPLYVTAFILPFSSFHNLLYSLHQCIGASYVLPSVRAPALRFP